MEFHEKKRWLFFGLPFTFTTYHVKEDLLTTDCGLLNRKENDCYMYKVQDVQLQTSLMERIFGLGSVVCFTADTTDPKIVLVHIKNARAVKDFILEMSEKARLKRRTVNTLNINAAEDGDDL